MFSLTSCNQGAIMNIDQQEFDSLMDDYISLICVVHTLSTTHTLTKYSKELMRRMREGLTEKQFEVYLNKYYDRYEAKHKDVH